MKIVRITLAVFIVVSIIVTATVGKNKIGQIRADGEAQNYKGIITVWQIDSFEGGSGSRKQFLMEMARAYEKEHEGVLVMVVNQTINSAEENVKNGIIPDAISFGLGTEIKNANPLNIGLNFVGGNVGNESYAIPWCRGGYALIYNPKLTDGRINQNDKIVVSQAEYTQPLIAFYSEYEKHDGVQVKSPMDAYVDFTNGKVPFLLGTQRDVVRLARRGMEVGVIPLSEYNDLYQYISVTSADGEKRYFAEEFIKFLLKEETQQKLNKICMFSVFYKGITYNEQWLNLMAETSAKKTLSAFTMPSLLKELQEISLQAVSGNEQAKIKMSNVLFLS